MKSTMNWRLKASLFCYTLFLLLTITFSVFYLFRTEFMPYHAAAVGQNWSEVNPAFQSLILGLMKAVGAAWLSLSIAITILLIKYFKQGIRWAFWAIPAIALIPVLVNLYVAINMALNTPASPPWKVAAFNGILLLVGFILSMLPEAKMNFTEE